MYHPIRCSTHSAIAKHNCGRRNIYEPLNIYSSVDGEGDDVYVRKILDNAVQSVIMMKLSILTPNEKELLPCCQNIFKEKLLDDIEEVYFRTKNFLDRSRLL